ncbi:dipeptidyl aminopeptidase/acylaminoacyl peptidase [Prauserella shujinwangii]|uniref:Dipeptidyl aminopeptidase/acylaminoacyl peptidase n=1 Tax=Prauserella shujinwangii TaxID=1453103 RepID=A0A2T0LP04_9PSEU|nr:prolyl oligopeptidase family serine peptidase [Prauserella shujinwangii]PRX44977.1 dipeptidyl aminopeptidase/acylaminoacyl peptidase [Prauserella shujinwangii]
MPETAPHGTWTSPLQASDVAAAGALPQWVAAVGGELWWAESRPAEQGRITLLRAGDDGPEELLPAPWSARNRLHEYGGRPWVETGGLIAFTHWADQRIHVRDPRTGHTAPVTPEPAEPHGVRYGDLRRGPDGQVWAVRETSTGPRRTDVRRDLVAVSPAGGEPVPLAASHHFLTAPQPSPDGRHAAWLGWDHPAMPWDGTELCVAEIRADGTFGPHRVVAGGPDVAVCQLEWESAGSLLALLDPGGWWNLHRVTLDGELTNLAPVERELGGALWKPGTRWFAPLGGGRHAVVAAGRLAVLDEATGTVTDVPEAAGLTEWSPTLTAVAGGVAGVAAGPRSEPAVVRLDLGSGTLTRPGAPVEPPAREHLPVPRRRWFGSVDGEPVPAYVYPPANPDHRAPDGELPPYVVHVHGGPTGRHQGTLDLEFAYFTSRGIGVVAVDYAGSTGYGRRYRERLREQWGVLDVADCVAVAEALVAEGTADPERLAIRGGSAGGFTSAAAITSVRTFRAATIKFPILDLAAWTGEGGETHDFESRYVEGLVGPLPDTAERYRERSPLHRAASTAGPVLLLQGLDDQICPPEQADRFVAALHGTGVPHAYLTFPGEQHGFRGAETIEAALEAELSFYGQVFGFAPPGVPRLELRR